MPSSLFHTLTISRQDILSRMRDLDVTSNNLANVNTAGYKTSRANFQEMLNQQLKEGNQLRGTQVLTSQGTLKETTSSLDWAIQGEGFFSVTLPEGTVNITVSADGTVSGQDATGASVNLGTMELTRFSNPSGLTSFGDNVWLESDASGAAQAGAPGDENFGTLSSFRVEQSNVELSQELTHLITLQRSFSMSLKAFEQTDAMISQAINLRKA